MDGLDLLAGGRVELDVETVLIVVALAFAFVNGVNDGGSLLSVGLTLRSIRPLTALLVLSVAVAVTPLLVGTAVATTLVGRLVVFDGQEGQVLLLVAVLVAVGVSFGLANRGLPTSLTLALVGAIAGSGFGAGVPVAWGTVGLVLLLAALAPVVGGLVGWSLTELAARWTSSSAPLHRRVRRWHLVTFGLQCLAYGANDGQKMLAVFAVAVAPSVTDVAAVPWQLGVVALCFLVGAAVGLPRFVGTIGGGLVPISPPDAVVTELSAASVVLGTAAVGSPVSMTQAISGALVGAGVTRGAGRIRWSEAVRIAGAWVVTLPLSITSSAAVAAIVAAISTS